MKHVTGTLLLLHLSLPTAFSSEILNSQAEECFATSMIGYDYVINSRAGLPIEKALNTVSVNQESHLIKDIYKFRLKSVVRGAYNWNDTPHLYAIKTMHACAFQQGLDSATIN